MPVRRHARLLELRVHRLGGPGRGRPSPAAGRHSRRRHLRALADASGRAVRQLRAATPTEMANQASFDITSGVDLQEVDNAVNQAKKEVAQRYDFKGSRAAVDLNRAENTITIVADDDFKLNALWEILQGAHGAARRADQEPDAGRDGARGQRHGEARHHAAAGHPHRGRQGHRAVPQGPQDEEGAGGDSWPIRSAISSASKDELQEAIRVLREHDFGVALQFGNYRELMSIRVLASRSRWPPGWPLRSRPASRPPLPPAAPGQPAARQCRRGARACEFLKRIEDYVALHKKLEATLPPRPEHATPQQVDAHAQGAEQADRPGPLRGRSRATCCRSRDSGLPPPPDRPRPRRSGRRGRSGSRSRKTTRARCSCRSTAAIPTACR